MYTRSRTKGALTAAMSTATQVVTRYSGSTSTANYTRDLPDVGCEQKVMLDCKVPRFKVRSARGETFVNPMYSDTLYVVSSQPMVGTNKRVTPLYPGEATGATKSIVYSNALVSHSFVPPKGESGLKWFPTEGEVQTILMRNASARDIAWNRALAGVAQTDALLLVTAAEAKKTLNLVKEYLVRSKRLFDKIFELEKTRTRKGKRLTSAELNKALAEEWLRIRYGVMTTVYEIEGVLKALNRGLPAERITSRATENYDDVLTASRFNNAQSEFGQSVSTRITDANGRVRAGLLYEPEVSLEKHLGLHWSAVPTSAFELVRLSFVANWFADLQETITGLTAFAHGKMLAGWITEELILTTTSTFIFLDANIMVNVTVNGVIKSVIWSHSGGEAALVTGRRVRTRTPVDRMVPTLPSLRVKLTPARVIDALALITTGLSRITPRVRI